MRELLKTRRPTNPEIEHFWRINMENIEYQRFANNRERLANLAEESLRESGSKCPKCGYDLIHADIDTVKCLKCSNCDGVFFNSDDLDSFLTQKKPAGLFSSLAKVLD